MFRSFALIALLLIALVATGCMPAVSADNRIVGSLTYTEKSFDLAGFSVVETSGGARVTLVQGDTYAIVVKINENAADHLDVRTVGNKLIIGMEGGSYRNVTLRATVTLPELTGAVASGGATIKWDAFTTAQPVSFTASGGADINGRITGRGARVNCSGGATITLGGQGDTLELQHSGGGTTRLGGFEVADARVNVSGGSQATIHATGKVTGEVTGGARLTVRGDPDLLNVRTSGGGKVSR